jgi:hypothetical protein
MESCWADQRNLEVKAMCLIVALDLKVKDSRQNASA